jgi:hypothetical protein
MVSMRSACRKSYVSWCAESKSTVTQSRLFSGFRLRTDRACLHQLTKPRLGNIVRALVGHTFTWLGRRRRLARDWGRWHAARARLPRRRLRAALSLASTRRGLDGAPSPTPKFRGNSAAQGQAVPWLKKSVASSIITLHFQLGRSPRSEWRSGCAQPARRSRPRSQIARRFSPSA